MRSEKKVYDIFYGYFLELRGPIGGGGVRDELNCNLWAEYNRDLRVNSRWYLYSFLFQSFPFVAVHLFLHR